MLRSLKEIEGYDISAEDGDFGSVADFYFDDDRWTIRYLVAEAGSFWTGNQVLVSPIAFRQTDWVTRRFKLALTIDKLKNSPSIDLAKPVSRQYEREYYGYYGWPYYWGDINGLGWGMGDHPEALMTTSPAAEKWVEAEGGDPHLRSVREVTDYHIEGKDGEIGHVADFIVDERTWVIRYLVVDTSNWWIGKKVLVAPHWATSIDWSEHKVHLALSRESIKSSPEWNPDAPVNREYEVRLYDYYGRPAYFDGDAKVPPAASTRITEKEIHIP